MNEKNEKLADENEKLRLENGQLKSLLRDIDNNMRAEWDARRLPAECWPSRFILRIEEALRP